MSARETSQDVDAPPSRCPRCEGYEATYHTLDGECSKSAAAEVRPVSYLQAVIKVNVTDTAEHRARDIEEGIGYACALLHDEYGRSADEIGRLLEQVTDDIADDEARRE